MNLLYYIIVIYILNYFITKNIFFYINYNNFNIKYFIYKYRKKN